MDVTIRHGRVESYLFSFSKEDVRRILCKHVLAEGYSRMKPDHGHDWRMEITEEDGIELEMILQWDTPAPTQSGPVAQEAK